MSMNSTMVFFVGWKIWWKFAWKLEKLIKSTLQFKFFYKTNTKVSFKTTDFVGKEIIDHHGLTNSSLVLLEACECFLGRYYQKSCQTNLRVVGHTWAVSQPNQSEPEPTNNAPWRMNGNWTGNSFLLGSSSCLFYYLPTNQEPNRWVVKTVLPYVESIYLPNRHLSSYIRTYIHDFLLTQGVTQGEIRY